MFEYCEMASFFQNRNNYNVTIPQADESNGIILYVIQMQVGNVTWTLRHRYSDFHDLHIKLVSDHGVPKDTLPPKKIIRTKCPYFISQRREGLEIYLKTVLNYLQRALPFELAIFLEFHVYEINYLLEELALQYFMKGDQFLSNAHWITMSPLKLHAISERLKQPCPTNVIDKQRDFSHVLDVCSQTKKLHIIGSEELYEQSNIVPNTLRFDFVSFKALKELRISNFPLANITELGILRETLNVLRVEKTNIQSISQVLLCDSIHKVPDSTAHQVWTNLVELNLSENQLRDIDETVKLMPKLKVLNCNQNQLCVIKNLAHLSNLSYLFLSANLFYIIENLHTKLGNLLHLDLSANFIKSLVGFSKLYSLEFLDISSNQIADINEVKHIGHLPCLENLRLTGNPVSVIVDYRVKVLEQFGTRASELCLDNEMPSQTELDTICVLQAIRIVKEGKTPTFDGTENPSLFMLNTTSPNT